MRYELGFIGAGNMAEAIAGAAIDKQVVTAEKIIAADPSPDRQAAFSQLGITVAPSNKEVISQSSGLLLAVKPQALGQIGRDLRGEVVADQQIIMSIMAGIPTTRIEAVIATTKPLRIVRIMPNTPLMAGCGMAGIALGRHAQPGDESLALRLFEASGKAIVVDEADLDAITAVSGSGPAYVFYLAEAMEAAAQQLGLATHARLLVQQTILGAAALLAQSSESPAQLRRKVTSPGGTTQAAVNYLDASSTTAVIIDAIKAADERSRQLGAS